MAQTMRALSSSTDMKSAAVRAPQRPAVAVRSARVSRQQAKQGASSSCPSVLRPQQIQRSSPIVSVAAQEAPASQATATKWIGLVANAEFFCNDVQNEPLAEQLRERVRYFKEIDRPIDFYLVPNPTWLDAKFPQQAKQVKRPCMALVSTDEQWMTFMKLRLDRVLKVDLSALSKDEVMAAGEELPDFKKPEKWTAPYSMYTPGWWKLFYPGAQPN